MNQAAKFWKYTGNHPQGKNHERQDPHGFGLELVATIAYWGETQEYHAPLNAKDVGQIIVTNHRGDSFGHEVTVRAPQEVWEKGKQALENFNTEYVK